MQFLTFARLAAQIAALPPDEQGHLVRLIQHSGDGPLGVTGVVKDPVSGWVVTFADLDVQIPA